jgi:hypothetical protein
LPAHRIEPEGAVQALHERVTAHMADTISETTRRIFVAACAIALVLLAYFGVVHTLIMVANR